MRSPQENDVKQLLNRLNSADPGPAWTAFIDRYAGLIMRTVTQFEFEQDRGNDCFLYVCEKLYERQFRRLLKFNKAGRPSFATWLSTFVFNLCIDWHRGEFGRARMLPAVAALPAFDQRVYLHCYEEGMKFEECYETLRSDIPGLAREQVSGALERIHALLTPRQRWQLNVRLSGRRRSGKESSGAALERIPDPAPIPEALAREDEEIAALQAALSRLTIDQRVLLYLRFREGLSFDRIARMEHLGDAHRARRRVRSALDALDIQLRRGLGKQKRQN